MLLDQVRDTINQFNMISQDDRVIVALSGGADSMALLSVLETLSSDLGFSLEALHVEHGIRGAESIRDMEYVKDYCQDNNIDISVVRVDAPTFSKDNSMTLEEGARALRYQALNNRAEQLAEEGFQVKIAVAHHSSDVAETVLFNIARGSGMDGMAGIKPVNDRIIRPLINCSRADIEIYLEKRGIQWVLDSTNGELDMSRNRIRHEIIPELKEINSQAISHIAKSASIISSAADFIEKQVDIFYDKHTSYCQEAGAFQLALNKSLLEEDEFIIGEVIHKWIGNCAGAMKDITSTHIQDTLNLLSAPCGKRLSLPYGLTIVSEENCLVALLEDKHPQDLNLRERFSFSVEDYDPNEPIPSGDYVKWFDYDLVDSYEVRTRRIGDYLQVSDSGANKSIKDYFINEKIPAHLRDQIPLLCDGDHVMWVVGYRISAKYKISPSTKKVLKVSYK